MNASSSAPTWAAVPTPIVSPSESCEAPRSNSRLPTSTTCATRHLALPRVAEAHRDVGTHVEPGVTGPAHGRLEHRELLVEAAVEVALRERLGGAAEDRDVPQPLLQRSVETALVGHQHRHLARHLAQLGHEQVDEVGGVGQLRHPLRVHEARRLDDGQAGSHQATYELGLGRGRHERRLVLQSVARADLVDRDPTRESGIGAPPAAAGSCSCLLCRARPPTARPPASPGRLARHRPWTPCRRRGPSATAPSSSPP